jgi:phosphatidylethanolamine-binding protein (PEBP) family uncharacterized protein
LSALCDNKLEFFLFFSRAERAIKIKFRFTDKERKQYMKKILDAALVSAPTLTSVPNGRRAARDLGAASRVVDQGGRMNAPIAGLWLMLVVPGLAACVAPQTVTDLDGGSSPDASVGLTLASSAFVDQGTYPKDFTCDGAGNSPPLSWSGVPAGTAELALMMTTETPQGTKWNWVLYRLPASTTSLPAGAMGVGTAGLTSDGPLLQYAAPCSSGPGAKGYVFTLFALSAAPSVSLSPSQVTGPVLTAAIADRTIASQKLTVSYTRP